MADIKIHGGNNRKCDLLAYNITTKAQYHAESSVAHEEKWGPTTEKLREIFDKKFLGMPQKRKGINTDSTKEKNYRKYIEDTYRFYGLNPLNIHRVFITWHKDEKKNYEQFLDAYEKQHGIKIVIWYFRNQILRELEEKISTSNYDDEVLRTLSLLKQRRLQTGS